MKVSTHKVKTKGRKSSTKTVTRNFSKRKSMRKQNRRRRRTRKMKKGGRKKTQKKRIKGGSAVAGQAGDDIFTKKKEFLQSFFGTPSTISDFVVNDTGILDADNTEHVKLSLTYPGIVVSVSEGENPILKDTLPDQPQFDDKITDIEIIHRAEPNGSHDDFDKSFKIFNLTPVDPNKGLKNTLERLHIENCKSFETIHTGTDETPSPALVTLYIKDCPSIKTLATLKLGSNAILDLHIEKCINLDTLFSIEATNNEQRTLKRLVLKDCPNIVNPATLIEILSNCTTIDDVTLDCLGLGENNENYSTIFNSINNCKKIKIKDPNLTTLNISDPPKENLTTLELDCAKLTAITLSSPESSESSATAALENKFPALTDLNLNNCNKLNLTTDFFKLDFINSLTSLDLTGVQSVNDETLSNGLLQSPRANLRSLSLQHCTQIKDLKVINFDQLPNLEYLNISYITQQEGIKFAKFLDNLNKSNNLKIIDMRHVIQNKGENFNIKEQETNALKRHHIALEKIIIQTQVCKDCNKSIKGAKEFLQMRNITLEEKDVRTKPDN